MDTYMYNSHLNDQELPEGEEPSEPNRQRPKVMDPRRLAYELKFERHMMATLEEKLNEREAEPEGRPDFDVSCVNMEKSINIRATKVREQREQEKARKIEEMMMGASAQCVPGHDDILASKLAEEYIVDAPGSYMEAIKRVYDMVAETGQVSADLLADALFNTEETTEFLESVAREPKGVSELPKESFREVYDRIGTSGNPNLSWRAVTGFFSRKGVPLAHGRSASKVGAPSIKTKQSSIGGKSSVRPEVKEFMQSFPMHPRDDGKGKYRITVPEPFKFDKRDKVKGKSIREVKLEEELRWKELEEQYEIAQQFAAKDIPKSTLEKRYEKILSDNERRRDEVKRQSKALTKANERPFSFYTREQEAAKEINPPEASEWDVMNNEPFKANPVPWYCKVNLYQRMVENDAAERENRVKTNAELSYSMAKLPPRMQKHQDEKQETENS